MLHEFIQNGEMITRLVINTVLLAAGGFGAVWLVTPHRPHKRSPTDSNNDTNTKPTPRS
jgi:hypothetical protein